MFHSGPSFFTSRCFRICKRSVLDSRGQRHPPQIPQVAGQYAQCQPHLVRAETMTTQSCHLHRLLSVFDPLLCDPTCSFSTYTGQRSTSVITFTFSGAKLPVRTPTVVATVVQREGCDQP